MWANPNLIKFNLFRRANNMGIGLLVVSLLLSSCRSHKDLTYLRDSGANGASSPRALPYTNYKVKINDNLFVSIITSNAQMNDIYNPASSGNNSSNSTNSNVWSTQASQFVYGYLIDQDGFLTLPAVGKIHVLGLTVDECEKEILSKVTQYLKDVTVKVRLLNYKVTVLGEVMSPGVYYNYNPEFTVFDAISLANGTKNTAALSQILVLREFGDQTQTYKLDLQSIGTLKSEGYNLQPNDVVIVQPAKFKNLELQLPIFTAALASVTTFLLVMRFIFPNGF